jgi:hypothetical protein
VLVLSTFGALKFNITVIAWVATTAISFSAAFSAFVMLVSHIVKPMLRPTDILHGQPTWWMVGNLREHNCIT